MKKVLCPVDFSQASENGMEYAAHVAKAFAGHLTLYHARLTIWPEAVQLEREDHKSTEEIVEQLQLLKNTVQKEFGVSCDYELDQTTDTAEMAISAKAQQFDLIVMGTTGADNLYRHFFGSHTFHIIEHTKCPVLFVPEGYAYQEPKKIIYAYDPESNPIFMIEQLLEYAGAFKSAFQVLYISTEKRSPETERKIEIMREAIRARKRKQIAWSFHFQYSDSVAWALDQYMEIHPDGLLAISCHHHTAFQKLLKENVVKQLSKVAGYPVFVFWH